MKSLLVLPFLIIIACSPTKKIIPLRGTYPNTPIEISSSKSFDQAWDRLIDLFAQNGLSIKIIDRSSGLLVSDQIMLNTTIEDKNGVLFDTSAYIVIPKYYNSSVRRYVPISKIIAGPYVSKSYIDEPDPVYGSWNVRIKKNGEGSVINVNLVNIFYYTTSTNGLPIQKYLNLYKSTGRFEKMIAHIINSPI